jgi:predicted metal-dependent hydrolase
MAPDPVLDYLVVHELVHRAQMNHSRRFWEVVERVCPDHRTHRKWLRKNGRALYALTRAS